PLLVGSRPPKSSSRTIQANSRPFPRGVEILEARNERKGI
ncbi:hypothetical protein WG66_008329, partial [Moniliophthora roreri]